MDEARPTAETAPADLTPPGARALGDSVAPLPSSEGTGTPDEAPVRGEVAGLSLVDVRQLWPGVLDRVKGLRRFAWVLLSQSAHVKDVGDRVITIGLVNAGARDSFVRTGGDEILRQALIDELGVDWRVEAIIDTPGQMAGSRTAPERAAPSPPPPSGADERRVDIEAAKEAIRPTRNGAPSPSAAPQDEASAVRDDDDVVEDVAVSSHELLARELGAEIIDDIRHDTA